MTSHQADQIVIQCGRCKRAHIVTKQPVRLPLKIECECGNDIETSDPRLKGLPRG
jgi:hypothetical protein